MKRKTKSKIAALLVICMCFPMSATARYTDKETFTNSSKAGNFIGELDVSKETELLNSSTNDISIYSISDTADENSILIENYTSNDFVFVDEDTGIEYTDKIATNSNAKYNKIASPSNAYMIDTYDLTDDIETYSDVYPVEINSDNFPDPVFLEYVSELDDNKNGILDSSESSQSFISLYGVEDLTGIECFANLKYLYIYDYSSDTLVMPAIDTLQELGVSGNSIKYLDVSNLTNLTSLDCQDNQIEELDLSNNTALEYLYCDLNELTYLDISHLTNLTQVYCGDNQLEELMVGNLEYLAAISASNNNLSQLDLSGCGSDFRSLQLRNNPIYMLTFPDNGRTFNLNNVISSDNWYTSLYMDSGTQITETSISATGQTIYHSETISLPFIFSMKNTGTCDGYFKTVFNLSTDDREQGFKTISFYKVDSTENVDWFNFDTTGLTPYYTTTAEDGQYYYALNDFGHGINSVGANLPVKIEAGNEEEYIYVIVLQAIPGNEFNLNIEAEFSAGTYSRSFQLYPNSGFTYNE